MKNDKSIKFYVDYTKMKTYASVARKHKVSPDKVKRVVTNFESLSNFFDIGDLIYWYSILSEYTNNSFRIFNVMMEYHISFERILRMPIEKIIGIPGIGLSMATAIEQAKIKVLRARWGKINDG